jgi:hypothetical protein
MFTSDAQHAITLSKVRSNNKWNIVAIMLLIGQWCSWLMIGSLEVRIPKLRIRRWIRGDDWLVNLHVVLAVLQPLDQLYIVVLLESRVTIDRQYKLLVDVQLLCQRTCQTWSSGISAMYHMHIVVGSATNARSWPLQHWKHVLPWYCD